jgi:hypothetical protein
MKPTIYRWQPTTCDCEIYEYMDENGVFSYLSPEEAEAKVAEIYALHPTTTTNPNIWKASKKQTNRCPAHASILGDSELGLIMRDEDSRKSGVLRAMLGMEGFSLNLHTNKTGSDGKTHVDFKDGVLMNAEYTGSGKTRVLAISVTGSNLTSNQKTTLKNFCDTKFGSGKVIVS